MNSNGLIYLLLVLVNILALREAYTGNPQWWVVHFVTVPLLLLYISRVYYRSKARKRNKEIKLFEYSQE